MSLYLKPVLHKGQGGFVIKVVGGMKEKGVNTVACRIFDVFHLVIDEKPDT